MMNHSEWGGLVNELLDLARMESGYFNLSIHEVELEPFFTKNYAEVSRTVERKECGRHL